MYGKYLISIGNLIGDLIEANNIPMKPLTDEQKAYIKNCSNCEMCESEFTMINSPVKDHCHYTGNFRSLLCNDCNLRRQNQKYLNVIIHNSSNYDNHFLIRQLGCDKEKIDVIPNTNEKYISFSKHTSTRIKLRFIDSFRFLSMSLSSLAGFLPKDKFKHTHLTFTRNEKRCILLRLHRQRAQTRRDFFTGQKILLQQYDRNAYYR